MFNLVRRVALLSLVLLGYSLSAHSQELEYSEHIYYYQGASFSTSISPIETAIRRCLPYGGFKEMRKPQNGASNHGYPNFLVGCNRFHNPTEIFVSTTCKPGWRKANDYCYRFKYDKHPATDSGPPSCGVGNPVNIANGRKYQMETDYRSSANPLLMFARYYNSFNAAVFRNDEPAALSSSNVASTWTHTYSNYISILSDQVNVGTHYLTLLRPSGEVEEFTQIGDVITPRGSNGGTDRLVTENGGFKYIVDSVTTEYYDSTGRFTKRIQGRHEVNAVYDASGQLAQITSPEGHSLSFVVSQNLELVDTGEPDLEEHTNPLLSAVVLPDGSQISFEHNQEQDSLNRYALVKVIYPDFSERKYNYDGSHRRLLTSIEDEKGIVFAEWTYNSDGRALSSKHANDTDTFSFSYGSGGITVTNPLGLTTQYKTQTVAGKGRLISTDQEGTALCAAADQKYTYDAKGNRISSTDWNGNSTTYTYNDNNQRISMTEAVGTASARVTSMQWHPVFNLPVQVTYPHKSVSTDYDAVGNVTLRVETDAATGLSRTWSYQYDSSYRLISVDGPRDDVNDTISLDYYNCTTGGNCGQVSTITNGLGQTTTYSNYNDHGQPTTIVDTNNVTSTIAYDLRQRITSVTTDGSQQSLAYDATGNIEQVSLADGTQINYDWDDANRLVAMFDAQNNRIDWVLDAAGNRTAETVKDPTGALKKSQTRSYDELSRLRSVLMNHGGQSQYEYDKNSNLVLETDADTRQTSYQVDALDRILITTDAAEGQTLLGYDTQNNVTSVTDPEGKVTTYTYNGFGDQLTVDSPDTLLSSYTYDAAGNRVSSTDARGITATYTFDALNRLTSVSYPNADENITYTYDTAINGVGRLARIDDQTGSVSFSYDARGNVTQVVQTTAGYNYTTGYQYNAADRPIGMTHPSGRQIDYGYDASGRVNSVTSTHNGVAENLATGITRLPFGPTVSMTLGNGIPSTRSFDLDYRINNLSHGSVLQRNYAYSAVSNITAITDSLNTAQSQLFTYDALDRLTFATGGYGEQSFTYDGIGNRLSLETTTDSGTQTQNYQYDANSHRLSAIAGERSFTYDAVGNTINNGNAAFTYNDRNRMSSASASGVTTSYEINALGQRVRKSSSAGETQFIYDLSGRLIAEADADGNIQVEYAYLDGEPLAMWRDADTTPPEPEPPTGDSLLVNGGFESGTSDWFSCSDNGTTSTSTDATQGSSALSIGGADCLYQEFAITAGTSYTVQCDAKSTGYASIAITAMDSGYNNLDSAEVVIDSSSYQSYSTVLVTPAAGAIGAVTFYSEGTANIDACSVVVTGGTPPPEPEPEPPVVDSLLVNGGFESGTSDWFSCSDNGTTSTSTDATQGSSALSIGGADCLYQEFAITAGISYTVQCDAKSTGYASIAITAMDSGYNSLDAAEVAIDSSSYQSYSTALVAPATGAIGAVTFYSEGSANIDACSVVVTGGTPPPDPEPEPPVMDSLLVNGGFESGISDWFSCSDNGTTSTSTDATQGSSALSIGGADCLYQEFAITAGTSYTVQCDAKATGYASIAITAMDSGYNSLDSAELTIDSSNYQSYSTAIVAPAAGAIGAVTFYSEGSANVDACSVVEGQ